MGEYASNAATTSHQARAAISPPGRRLKQYKYLQIISFKCNEGDSSGWWKDKLIIDGYEMDL